MSLTNEVQITEKVNNVFRDGKPCYICRAVTASYTCPRCGISYCSAACYKHKNHFSCSEVFFKKCFQDEMLAKNNDEQEKRDLIEIIRRVEQDTPYIDYDEVPTLEERLAGIDINNLNDDSSEELWQRLTMEEQTEFQAMMNPRF